MAEGRHAFALEPDGFYVEPAWCTDFLLDRESFADMVVWDPACGGGNIVKTLRQAGLTAFGTDLRLRVGEAEQQVWCLGTRDFLEYVMVNFDAIVTNPPYGHAKTAEAFIRRALEYGTLQKLAVFVNAKFMFSKARAAGLFKEHPPTRIWPILPRPSCPPGQYLKAGGKATGGVADYVWMVWEPGNVPAYQAGRPMTLMGW